jgi:site-specific DNA-methyltransferase (adenine-specific)
MCGDSTALGDVEKLLDGAEVDLVVTDPPYNMAYEGAGNTRDRASKRIMNDKMSSDQFREFLTSIYTNYYCVMKDGASIYVFYKELGEGVFITSMNAGGLTYKQELIWVKDHLVLGGSKYQSQYEPFLMGCKGKSIKVWNGARNQRSVIESIDFMTEDELRDALKNLLSELNSDIIREKKQLVNDLHPTMKPVRLIAKLIQNSSNKGDCVLDLFGGSGTTMIAAEQTGRSAYLMELDPKFVDVIVRRYEQFTGNKAVLLSADSIADEENVEDDDLPF